MDFRHLIVTCLFSMLRLSFETQKIKKNYSILKLKLQEFFFETSGILDEKCMDGRANGAFVAKL